ncbi:type II toxin-antitoxin system VapC family toxin [Parasulfuritortus cantonensis]|uniref:Ribonuclease VapC n=1 Tax=Parasulfuritortus cantonensis TaxID=2528202 RepID=A0A4R1BCF6_9PROT|nr:type II toxin-antitoxin system VapC family toxin [Parasulfuritortus cantonensis]TCJ14716.1 type II toxin-antitoxin system VapC family toxin [Parasulfuritortus cantonensis]
MAYLLDTNILIAMSKERPGLAERLARHPASAILLSSVVVAEIEYGIAKSTRAEHNRRVFDCLLGGFPVIPFDEAAARAYGPIRAQLEREGRLIGPNDLMIAAHARALGAVLVTDNVGEFARVDGLALENWLA